jgi:hypothetical protein
MEVLGATRFLRCCTLYFSWAIKTWAESVSACYTVVWSYPNMRLTAQSFRKVCSTDPRWCRKHPNYDLECTPSVIFWCSEKMSSSQSGDETGVKLRLCLGAHMTTSAEPGILQLGAEGDPALRDAVATSCKLTVSIVRQYWQVSKTTVMFARVDGVLSQGVDEM